MYQGTLPDYTAEGLAGASKFFVEEWVPNSTAGDFYYKTVRGHFTRLRGGGPGERLRILWGEKMGGFCPHIL